jgi:hypothetical protein
MTDRKAKLLGLVLAKRRIWPSVIRSLFPARQPVADDEGPALLQETPMVEVMGRTMPVAILGASYMKYYPVRP